MTDAPKKTGAGRIITLIAVGILPLLLLLMGIICMLGDSVVTASFVITFFALPVLTYVGCFMMIRSKCRPIIKIVGCILLLVAMLFLFVFLMGVGHFSIFSSTTGQAAVEEYEKDTYHISQMPDVSEICAPQKITYRYFYNQMVTFFESDCYMLFCQYSEVDYQDQLEKLHEQYVFQKEMPTALGYSVDVTTIVDGYEFQFLSFEEYGLMYPKYMMLIATNEETNEIVYIWYDDDDLDYIESMEEHILEDFGWKYIR